MGRSIFPKVEPDREIAKRVEELTNQVAERATSGYGAQTLGKGMERWNQTVAGWKFMDAPAESSQKTGSAASGLENLRRMELEFDGAEGAARPALAVRLGTAWGKLDPEGAIAWSNSLTDEAERSAAHQAIAKGWGSVEPFAASEWVAKFPPGPERAAVVNAFVKSSAKLSPMLALGFSLSVPDRIVRAELVDISLKYSAVVNPEDSADALRSAELPPKELEDYLESLASFQLGGGANP